MSSRTPPPSSFRGGPRTILLTPPLGLGAGSAPSAEGSAPAAPAAVAAPRSPDREAGPSRVSRRRGAGGEGEVRAGAQASLSMQWSRLP